jgi:hypothetical protein
MWTHEHEEAAMARVRRRDIVSAGDRAAVMGLRRGPGQDQYLNSMEEIFAEAREEQRAMPHPGRCTTPGPARWSASR